MSKKKKDKYKIIYHNAEPSYYGINKRGKIINMITGHEMAQRLNINGYYIVRLSFEKYHRTEVLVHRLVATYFVDNPENKPLVHHIDKDKLNNSPDNLIWVTPDEHIYYHENDESHPFCKGARHSGAILSEDDVHKICLYIENNQYTQIELAEMFHVNTQVIREIRCKNNWTHISDLYDFSNYSKLDWKASSIEVVINICKDIISNKYKAKQIAKRNNVTVDTVQRIRRGESFKNITKDFDLSVNTTIRVRKKINK